MYGVMITSSCLPTGLFELHGNSNVEKCAKCKHEYLRDYRVVGLRNHETGTTYTLYMSVEGSWEA